MSKKYKESHVFWGAVLWLVTHVNMMQITITARMHLQNKPPSQHVIPPPHLDCACILVLLLRDGLGLGELHHIHCFAMLEGERACGVGDQVSWWMSPPSLDTIRICSILPQTSIPIPICSFHPLPSNLDDFADCAMDSTRTIKHLLCSIIHI